MKLACVVLLAALGAARPDKVSVELAYETMCPGCASLIREDLVSLYQAMPDRLDVKLVPFGNAKLHSDGTMQCQHGPQECEGNQLHACLVHLLPVSTHLPLIACMESVGSADSWTNLRQCGPKYQVDEQAVRSCFSSVGPSLMQQAAAETARMQHTYVPWVLINGQHDQRADFGNLQDVVCQLLQDPKPDVCNA